MARLTRLSPTQAGKLSSYRRPTDSVNAKNLIERIELAAASAILSESIHLGAARRRRRGPRGTNEREKMKNRAQASNYRSWLKPDASQSASPQSASSDVGALRASWRHSRLRRLSNCAYPRNIAHRAATRK